MIRDSRRLPGIHLNERGQKQAEALGEALKDVPITAIYSSPLERCVQTAEPVATALGQQVNVEPGVIEVDYGQWQGGDLKELSKLPEWQ